ncbi:stevor PIR protein, putative [Plasmodium sp. gorilla clade G2]|uniref:stevor PIR protein, putative n=1 Tax=Plasmodium sp. gorilla clade G2 TaxID=880535 RepID=UPI000D281EFE|nr:stevor PIR protein, putative [Plasmodium sp. gorilla clade G2]SOV20366.1 stevor PIR protein, putative [Plasmodium sp. gorilla clade G2]
MICYNIKLIILSIILGTLALNFNNNCDGLYKNINYKNILLMPTYLRSLAELSYGLTTNHKHEKCKLREYTNNDERRYKKNKYPKDDEKTKKDIPEVTEKEKASTENLKKYKKETYDNEKVATSNRSSRSLKYLEMQRKLYNNFYVKPDMDFEKFSDKSNAKNDKSCEWANNKRSSDKLSSKNNVHDNYLDNLKTGCVAGVGVCTLSSTATGIAGGAAVTSAAYYAAQGALKSSIASLSIESSKLANILYGVSNLTANSIQGVINSAGISGLSSTPAAATAANAAASAATAAKTAAVSQLFYPYGLAALVLIIIVVVLIILYIWLYRRRKNSWKHECKKHLCT